MGDGISYGVLMVCNAFGETNLLIIIERHVSQILSSGNKSLISVNIWTQLALKVISKRDLTLI